MHSRRESRLWLRCAVVVALVVLPLLLGLRLATTGLHVDTDIQSILPRSAADMDDIAAIQQAGIAASPRIVFGVRGGTRALRMNGAARLEAGLLATGLFIPASTDIAETAAWIRANRYELTCEPDVNALDSDWGSRLARKARVLLFSGMVPLSGIDLTEDPFLLQLEHLECLTPIGSMRAIDDQTAVVAGRLTASPYRLDVQARLREVVEQWRQDNSLVGLDLLRTGAVFFAEAAGERAQQEISRVGGTSVVLILLLYVLAFRNPATAALALATVAAGALGGSSLCFVIFGQVHFSVFVFGSALTGVSADYAVHSLAARRAGQSAGDGAAPGGATSLRRALTISMLTSVTGFAALLLFDIDVFRQIGVFAIGGLFLAWLFAIAALPRLDRLRAARPHDRSHLLRLAGRVTRLPRRWSVLAMAVGLVVLVALPGLLAATFIDDLRRFQAPSQDLVADRDILYPNADGQLATVFLLSSGDDRQAALRNEEDFLAGAGSSAFGFVAPSRFDPSEIRRASVREAYSAYLLAPHLASLHAELGLEGVASTIPPPVNDAAGRPAWLAVLEFEREGRTFLLAPMLASGALATSSVGREARLIDPVATYGRALRDYRQIAFQVIAASTVFAAVFIYLVYRRVAALLLVLPPVAGCVLALSLPALLGVPVTLFSVLALFIVLGTGIDFSVFQWEMRKDRTGWTGVAVVVAALSTCAAMGMLGFSDTLPVQSFGITIAIGVIFSMAFSFLLPISDQEAPRANAHRI